MQPVKEPVLSRNVPVEPSRCFRISVHGAVSAVFLIVVVSLVAGIRIGESSLRGRQGTPSADSAPPPSLLEHARAARNASQPVFAPHGLFDAYGQQTRLRFVLYPSPPFHWHLSLVDSALAGEFCRVPVYEWRLGPPLAPR